MDLRRCFLEAPEFIILSFLATPEHCAEEQMEGVRASCWPGISVLFFQGHGEVGYEITLKIDLEVQSSSFF